MNQPSESASDTVAAGNTPATPLPIDSLPSPSDDLESTTTKPRRSSVGRGSRVYPPNTPRVQMYHRLDESQFPSEVLRHPHAYICYELITDATLDQI